RQQRGAQWRYCRRADRRRNNAETICDRAWPAVSQGGKPTLSQFTSSPRTEDSRRDGLAGAQARTAQETLSEKSEARTQSSEVVRPDSANYQISSGCSSHETIDQEEFRV